MKKLKQTHTFKYLIVFGLIFISANIFAQKNWETKEKRYLNGVALSGLLDVDKKEVAVIKPFAKSVNITYDPFYNKYVINFNKDGSDSRMVLVISGKASNGSDLFIDEYSPKNKQVDLFVMNSIDTDGKLIVMTANPLEIDGIDYKMIYIFEDFD